MQMIEEEEDEDDDELQMAEEPDELEAERRPAAQARPRAGESMLVPLDPLQIHHHPHQLSRSFPSVPHTPTMAPFGTYLPCVGRIGLVIPGLA